MYTLINQHIGELLQNRNLARDVQRYIRLREDVGRLDTAIIGNQGFQRMYRTHWGMNGAYLSAPFYDAYFGLLHRLRGEPLGKVNVETVARELLEVPARENGRQALQFSFASKMVHMLRPDCPIYDKRVERFYFLPEGAERNPEVKLARLLQSYRFLIREYQRVRQDNLLARANKEFRAHFQVESEYSDEKVIDTLIWAFVKFLQGGAVRGGVVEYS